MLEQQTKYAIELVNNQKFYEWAVSGESNGSEDNWESELHFYEIFGSFDNGKSTSGTSGPVKSVVVAPPLRTVNEMNSALRTLYEFRYYKGLEDEFHWRRR